MNANQPIRIQILAANDQAGRGSLAVGLVRQHLPHIADIAQKKGAEAMLVCPAPEEFVNEGIDIVVAARFGRELAQDVLFCADSGEGDQPFRPKVITDSGDRDHAVSRTARPGVIVAARRTADVSIGCRRMVGPVKVIADRPRSPWRGPARVASCPHER